MTVVRWSSPELPLFTNPEGVSLDVDSVSIEPKFGRNPAVSTTVVPICFGGFYRTPTALTSLEILSDDPNDDAAGTGAREVTIYGIVDGWVLGSTTVEMDGTNAVAIDTQFYRIFRVKVTKSGTYASQSSASQKGTITVRGAGGGDTWCVVGEISAGFGVSQSQIGAYTIPSGKVGYIKKIFASVDSGKTASLYMFVREHCDDVSAPYTGVMQVKLEADGLQGPNNIPLDSPLSPMIGPCDVGFMGKVASTDASMTIDFEIMMFDIST